MTPMSRLCIFFFGFCQCFGLSRGDLFFQNAPKQSTFTKKNLLTFAKNRGAGVEQKLIFVNFFFLKMSLSIKIFQTHKAKMDASASSKLLTHEENRRIYDIIQ